MLFIMSARQGDKLYRTESLLNNSSFYNNANKIDVQFKYQNQYCCETFLSAQPANVEEWKISFMTYIYYIYNAIL